MGSAASASTPPRADASASASEAATDAFVSASMASNASASTRSSSAPSSTRMSTTRVNSSHPAATYSPTRLSARSMRVSSFWSLDRRRRFSFTARRMSLNRFISAISARVDATLARCWSKNATASASPTTSNASRGSDSSAEKAARAASVAASAPSARHRSSPSRRHFTLVRAGGEPGDHPAAAEASPGSAGGTRDVESVESVETSPASRTARTRPAAKRTHDPSSTRPMNSPSGYGFGPRSSGSSASTTATRIDEGSRLFEDAEDASEDASSPSSSPSSSSSSSSSSSKSLSIRATTDSDWDRDWDWDGSVDSPSSSTDHAPSSPSRTLGAGAIFSVFTSGNADRGCASSPSSSSSSPSARSATNTGAPSSSNASRTRALFSAARASSVCLATIFNTLRSSLSLPSSLTYLAHSSGSTMDSPVSICSRSASACSRRRRSSRVCSRLARPPR